MLIRSLKRSLVIHPPQGKPDLDGSIHGFIVEMMQQKASLMDLQALDSRKTNKADSELMLKTIHHLHAQLYTATVVLQEATQLINDPQPSKVQFCAEQAGTLVRAVKMHNPLDLGIPSFIEPSPFKQKRFSMLVDVKSPRRGATHQSSRPKGTIRALD